jgi:signal transduction histidine kinase
MAELSVPNLGQACVVCLLTERGPRPGEVAVTKHVDVSREKLLTTLAQSAFGEPRRLQRLLNIVSSGRPAVLSQLATAVLLADGRPPHVLLGDVGVKTAMLVPVMHGERPLAIAMFLSDRTRHYAAAKVRLAEELASRFALALEAAQIYQGCQVALEDSQESLATTIHDLMSPLTCIKGMSQRLRRLQPAIADPAASVEFCTRLEAIDSAVTRIASGLSTLLQASRPRPDGWGEGVSERIDLVALTRRAVATEQLTARQHSIRINDAPTILEGAWDAHRLECMLGNLIGNAVKYSPPGSSVEVSLTSEVDSEGHWAVVRVAVHGIGIPARDLPFVFEPFHRGSNVGRVGGTGLGLASVWQTIKTHDGRLCVDSEEGEGTCVTVRLPLVEHVVTTSSTSIDA